MSHFLLHIVCLLGEGHTDLGITCLRKRVCFCWLHMRKVKKKTVASEGLGIIMRVSGNAAFVSLTATHPSPSTVSSSQAHS